MSNVRHNLSAQFSNCINAVTDFTGGILAENDVLDRFTTIAATIFKVPVALIALFDDDRLRFKPHPYAPAPIPSHNETISHCIISAPLLIYDAKADPRTADSQMVIGFGVRFYFSVPLITPEGRTIGAFALADTVPHPQATENDFSILAELAHLAVVALDLRHVHAGKNGITDDLTLRQNLTHLIASAPTLTAALDGLLSHVGHWFDAIYCAVCECNAPAESYRVISGFSVEPALATILQHERRSSWRPLNELSFGAALRAGTQADSGPITNPAQVAAYPGFVRAVNLGTRRQLTVPITADDRTFALSIGFRNPELTPRIRAICADIAEWITPLLQGRLREDALARANALLARSNRALQTLHASRTAMEDAADETSLAQTLCNLAVSHGSYSAAWVGIAMHDEQRTLRPIAMAGTGINRLFNIHISWADTAHGRGPSGTAVRENRPVVIDDILNTEAIAPWRHATDLTGAVSALAVPLRDAAGKPFGCMTLLATNRTTTPIDTDTFDGEEIRLLSQLAADLAYGITALRTRDARDAALTEQHATTERLARVLDASPTVVYALERPPHSTNPSAWRLIEISGNIERLYGYEPASTLAPGWWFDRVHPDDRAEALAAERRLLTEQRVTHRYRFARSDGTYRWLRDEKTVLPGLPGEPDEIVGAWVDITEKYLADQAIHRLAFYHPLTDLPNRTLLQSHLGQSLIEARLTGQHGTLLIIALEGIDAIQDLHGHATGDAVLRHIARTLLAGRRRHDVVAHIGTDKFAILLAPLADTAKSAAKFTQRIAEKLLLTLAQTIHAAGNACHISAHIGIAMVPSRDHAGHDTPVDSILRQADMAVRNARASDRTPTLFFERHMQEQVAERHVIELALRDAITHNRFEVWLQSQVDQTGRVTGAEALIRLRRPDGILVQPNDFIPTAEDTGIVFAMGRWMLREVCQIIASQISRGQHLRISINVSPRQFHAADFVTDIEAALATTGADASCLMIEITESLLIDRIEETRALLNTLAARGISFSVDDFGTGYSSLGYLQNLPIAEIKIDRSFIQRLPDSPRDAILAEAILSMTRHLGLAAVAEGVETEDQAEFLRSRQCNTMQGFLFGRPEPAALWLAQWDTE